MPVAITAMQMSDYDDAMAFWKNQEGIGVNASDSREQIAMFLAHNPGMSLVVRDGARLIGTALCGHDGRRGFLYHVAVDASHRNNGLGRQIVERCIARLAQDHIQKCNIVVFANNEAGHLFWEKLGFKTRDDLHIMQRVMPPTA